MPRLVIGDAAITVTPAQSPQILQDPKTKVVYYLESDRRHVAAISPSGKLLWCRELVFASSPLWISVRRISFWNTGDYPFKSGSGDDYISVTFVVHEYGFGGTKGIINKKTGACTMEPVE
jgi:hypothetical protein